MKHFIVLILNQLIAEKGDYKWRNFLETKLHFVGKNIQYLSIVKNLNWIFATKFLSISDQIEKEKPI